MNGVRHLFPALRPIRRCSVWKSSSTLSYMRSTTIPMATITVRLDADDERLLDDLASTHGDRSTVIREAIRLLSGHEARRKGMREFLDQWEAEVGPIDQAEVDEMARRFGL